MFVYSSISNKRQVFHNSNNKTNNVKFKAINLVQMPKSIFPTPESTTRCTSVFENLLLDATNNQFARSFLGKQLYLFTPRFRKTMVTLENYSNFFGNLALEHQNKSCSLSWLRQNTKLPIGDVFDNKLHTFYVFTKQHKDKLWKVQRYLDNKTKEFIKEGIDKYPTTQDLPFIYAIAKVGAEGEKLLGEMIRKTPKTLIQIGNFSDIWGITKYLDV